MKLGKNLVRTALTGLMAIATAAAATSAVAESADYPKRQPVRLIVGYPAGGTVDLNARLLGEALADHLGQNVVVENLGGAGGTIAAQKVVKEKSDGYVLFLGSLNEMVIAQLVNPSVKYDGQKDFTPIGLIGTQPVLLAASKKSNIKNMDDYIRVLKQGDSESYSFGSSGIGTAFHLLGEMINAATDTQVQHVPYRGVPPLVTDMLSGQLDFGVFGISSGLPHVQSGAIIPLGTSLKERSAFAPDVPALSENPALKDLNISSWFGLFGPKNMPEDVVAKLKGTLNDILNDPAFKDKYAQATFGSVYSEPVDMQAFLEQEHVTYQKAAQQAGIGR